MLGVGVFLLLLREPVVVRADAEVVTVGAFAEHYGAYLRRTGVLDTPALRSQCAREMIVSRLLIRKARDAGVTEGDSYRARERKLGRRLLIDAYLHAVVWDTLAVADAEVRDMFVRSRSQITARHLCARTRAEADSVHARVMAGETFEALARELFLDPKFRDTGGLLGTFTLDEMDAALEDAAFTLPVGIVSEPIRTAQGYCILRVDDRFTHPLITEAEYAARRRHFAAYTLRRKRERARRRLVVQVLEESRIAFDEAVQEVLLSQISGSAAEEAGVLQELQQRVMLEYGSKGARVEWTVAEFRERARFVAGRHRARVRTRAELEDFAQGLVVNEILVERALRMGLDRNSAYSNSLTEALDKYIMEEIREELEEGPAIDEDSIRAYFDGAPPNEFMRTAEAYVDASRVQGGVAWSGYASRRELGSWSEAVFSAEEGQVLGPLVSAGGSFMLRVGATRPAGPMPYEQARPRIVAMLHRYRIEARRRELYEGLVARHDIRVDARRLAEVVP